MRVPIRRTTIDAMSYRGPFIVADLNVRGELQLKASYEYEQLEQVPGAADLIAHPSSEKSGKALRNGGSPDCGLAKPTCICAGDPPPPPPAWRRLQRRRPGFAEAGRLRDRRRGGSDHPGRRSSGIFCASCATPAMKPAFGLMDLKERPLVATINFRSPSDPTDQLDSCWPTAASPLPTSAIAAGRVRFAARGGVLSTPGLKSALAGR